MFCTYDAVSCVQLLRHRINFVNQNKTSSHRLSVLIPIVTSSQNTKYTKQKSPPISILDKDKNQIRMISLARFLPLLVVASTPLCSSFAPSNPSINTSRRAQISTQKRASSGETKHSTKAHGLNENVVIMERSRVGKATAGSTLVAALTLSFFAITAPYVPTIANAADNVIIGSSYYPSSITIASSSSSSKTKAAATTDEDATIQYLEREAKLAEKEAKADAQKAKIEKSRESFFEYDAKMAAQAEARIEAAEQRTLLEAKTDKELAEKLKLRERKAEEEAALASTPKEKAAKQKEARELLRLEKLAEKKEKEAERAERVFLAEEEQERKILKQKTDAALAVRTVTYSCTRKSYFIVLYIVAHQRPISFTHTLKHAHRKKKSSKPSRRNMKGWLNLPRKTSWSSGMYCWKTICSMNLKSQLTAVISFV